ncbi:hypothetical protein H4R34_002578 [Dimargaris verticillata]|uniref:Mitochondrial carrier domain-containing protein n=1 Tax=Dimargaris verticillata TaxID=2761393 RepID=A0A9W8B8K6_9FUNG|nr:hypothetical protein H4R34_002578 [Dimargaris verticillata]
MASSSTNGDSTHPSANARDGAGSNRSSHRPYADPVNDLFTSPDATQPLNPLAGMGYGGLAQGGASGSSILAARGAMAGIAGAPGSSNGFNIQDSYVDANNPYAGYLDYNDPRLQSREAAAQNLAKFAGLRYLTLALSNPFEVAQTLLQVQYTPSQPELLLRDGLATTNGYDSPGAGGSGSEMGSEMGGHDSGRGGERVPGPEDPGYYEYLRSHPPTGTATSVPTYSHSRRHPTLRADHTGYFVPSANYLDDDGTSPAHQLPLLDAGTWGALKQLYNHPGEGVLSVFKGQFSGWLWEMAQLLVQPTLEGLLNDTFNLYDDTIPLVHLDHYLPNLSTLVSSHLITGVLLSPLELIRTRLMIQTSLPSRRKYQGVFSGLATILREEGGFWAMYLSSVHLIPTMMFHTLRPLFENCAALFLNRVLGLSAMDAPVMHMLAELGFRTLELAVMLPIDTIRKRLQAQPRYTREFLVQASAASTADPAVLSSALSGRSRSANSADQQHRRAAASNRAASGFRPFYTLVPLSPVPYTGMLNCAYRIITEEGLSPQAVRRDQSVRRGSSPALNQHDPLQEAITGHGVSRSRRKVRQSSSAMPLTWGLRGLYQGFTLHLTSNLALTAVGLVGGGELEG